jgi:hypothetical protein
MLRLSFHKKLPPSAATDRGIPNAKRQGSTVENGDWHSSAPTPIFLSLPQK